MAPAKQTSARVSSIGAKYGQMTNKELFQAIVAGGGGAKDNEVLNEIRSALMSTVSQDETKGQ